MNNGILKLNPKLQLTQQQIYTEIRGIKDHKTKLTKNWNFQIQQFLSENGNGLIVIVRGLSFCLTVTLTLWNRCKLYWKTKYNTIDLL